MNVVNCIALLPASFAVLTAQVVQPDFSLPDVNPDSVRNVGQATPQSVSPLQYRQQISAYYFSQEW